MKSMRGGLGLKVRFLFLCLAITKHFSSFSAGHIESRGLINKKGGLDIYL